MKSLFVCLVLFLITDTVQARGSLNLTVQRKIKAVSAELLTAREAQKALNDIVKRHGKNPNHLTFVSSTDASVSDNFNNVIDTNQTIIANALSRVVYLDFPYDQIKNRVSRSVNSQFGHLNDRFNAAIFTFMVGNSFITNVIFTSDIQTYISSMVIGANALATALVTLHPTNYSKILQLGKKAFTQNRIIKKLNSRRQDFISSVTTSTIYNLFYQGALQTIFNWNNLENLLGADVITSVLTSVGITVTASTAWQETLNSLRDSGRLSEELHHKLTGGRTMIMVLLGTLMTIGVPNTTYGTLAFALIGVEAYILESNRDKVEAIVNKIKKFKRLPSSFKFNKLFKNPFKRERVEQSFSSYGSCRSVLGY